MLGIFKRGASRAQNTSADLPQNQETSPTPSDSKAPGFFRRLSQGLTKTKQQFTDNLSRVLGGKRPLDEDLIRSLETVLLSSDLGMPVTQSVLEELRRILSRTKTADTSLVLETIKTQLRSLLERWSTTSPWTLNKTPPPFVILVVGVNGAGKTTTIGKLAKFLQQQDKKVLLAAGDTFRAAAIEQLQIWGERNQIPVIAQKAGADSASVIFDAIQAGKARGVDFVIADTAGRLHTQSHLMDELKKVKRVIQKLDPNAPHEVLLVLDAGIGQNALNQAREFHAALGVSSIALTKLDGTAKGGVLFAITQALQIPIRFIGVGEQIEDLRPFNAQEFVDALFEQLSVDEPPLQQT